MLVAVLHLRSDVLTAAVLAQAPPAKVRREVTRVVEEAFARLTAAFADLDAAR